MKKFSELTDEDFNNIDSKKIDMLGGIMLNNPSDEYKSETFDSSEEAIESMLYAARNNSGLVLEFTLRYRNTGAYILNRMRVYNRLSNRYSREEFIDDLIEIDNFDIMFIDQLLAIESDEIEHPYIFSLVSYNGKLYCDSQLYFWKKYSEYKNRNNIIDTEDYFWFGKLSGATLQYRKIGVLNTDVFVDSTIMYCTIRKASLCCIGKDMDIVHSKIKLLSITVKSYKLNLNLGFNTIGKLVIDLSGSDEYIYENGGPVFGINIGQSDYFPENNEVGEIEIIVTRNIVNKCIGKIEIATEKNIDKIIKINGYEGKLSVKTIGDN